MKSRLLTLALLALVLALVGAACGGDDETAADETGVATGPAGTQEADACAKENLALVNEGQLTISTSNPAFPPWFFGPDGGPWDPTTKPTKEGYEAAVSYAVAQELGFSDSEVEWTEVTFDQSFAPGPKDFDFGLQQISYKPARAEAVDFTDSYYDVSQAVVAPKDSPIADATTVAELQDSELGAPVGTTSFDVIVETVQTSEPPAVYNNLNDAVQALKVGQVDGIVVDLPTAFFITAVQAPDSKIVGQFPPAAEQEYFGLVLEKDSPLTECLNQALAALREDGTLDSLQDEWLSESAPVLE
jgi:polar amino acid transport system substrate-binding protein